MNNELFKASVNSKDAAQALSHFNFVAQGYTETLPTKQGIYWMVCDELDYEPELIKIDSYPITNELCVHCSETGIWPVEHYDLTNLMWKQFSPGAVVKPIVKAVEVFYQSGQMDIGIPNHYAVKLLTKGSGFPTYKYFNTESEALKFYEETNL